MSGAAPSRSTLMERALLDADVRVRSERNAVLNALRATNFPETKWLQAYIMANDGDGDRAESRVGCGGVLFRFEREGKGHD